MVQSLNIQFDLVKEEDRDFYVFVHHESYKHIIEEMFGWDEVVQDKFAHQAFDHGEIYIIRLDDKKVGVVEWGNFDEYVWLKGLYILPEYQNKGIGSHILRYSLDKAKHLRKDIRVQTLKANMRAKNLYESLGFEVCEETDVHWKLVSKFIP